MPNYQVGFWQHFSRLLKFGGREDRGSFWPWALSAAGLAMVLLMAGMLPVMANVFANAQQYAVEHPDQVTVTHGPGEYGVSIHGDAPGLMPDMTGMFVMLAVAFGVAICLLGAAVARRLHDRGLAGWWGLMPVPFILYSAVQMPAFFGTARAGKQPDMTIFFSVFFSNMLYLASLVMLIILLSKQGDPVENQYG